jgi:hypothetical protein
MLCEAPRRTTELLLTGVPHRVQQPKSRPSTKWSSELVTIPGDEVYFELNDSSPHGSSWVRT